MDEVRAELAKPSRSGPCTCNERLQAVRDGEFTQHAVHGWIFPHDAYRSSTWEQRYQADANHDGEPFAWTVCPWCGFDLSDPPDTPYPTDSEGPE